MHGRWKACCFLVLTLCTPIKSQFKKEQFREELSIRPLHDGRVLSRFSFTTQLNETEPRDPRSLALEDDDSQHYSLFPLTLGQILREYAVTELHLSLNAGKWNYESWGYPEELGVGTGAELWAWMGDGAPTSIDDRWSGLRNALAGLFCASLGSMDEQRTTSPYLSFSPEGSLPQWERRHQMRHASLPSEHVCTENLTPFLKLLPCKSNSGIAMLLNPHRLFDADWHGMGLHVVWHPESGIEVRLVFQVVSDPLRSASIKKRDWSLRSLFDRTIDKSCPVAFSSQVRVELPVDAMYRISPEPTSVDEDTATFDLKTQHESLDIEMKWATNFFYPQKPPEPPLVNISIQRSLQGSSQARGVLAVVLKNSEPVPVHVIYLETMPWLIQFFLHTMRIYADGIPRDDLISNISYIPPVPHSRPATFQSVLTLPGHSTVHFNIDVTKAFLRYTEHPPDAQRGWDLPPAIFVPLRSSNNTAIAGSFGNRIYTPTLLVDLATPDFSMPYNVIIFSCSLVAFIFGTVFNLLTRKFVVIGLAPVVPAKQ